MSYLSEIGIQSFKDGLNLLADRRLALKGFSTLLDLALRQEGGALSSDCSGIVGLLDRQLDDIGELEDFFEDEFSRAKAQNLKVSDANMIAHVAGVPVIKVERVIQVAVGIDLSSERVRSPFEAESAEKEVIGHLSSRALVSEGWLEVAAAVADIPVDALSVAFDTVIHLDPDAIKTRPRDEYVAELKTKITHEKTVAFLAAIKQGRDEATEISASNAEEMRAAFIRTKAAEGADTAAIAQALNMKKATVDRVIGQLLAGSEPEVAKTASDDGRTAVNE